MVKLLACGTSGPGSIPGLTATISEIGYLLLPSRDMAERSLKQRKSSKQPTNILLWYQLNDQANFKITLEYQLIDQANFKRIFNDKAFFFLTA